MRKKLAQRIRDERGIAVVTALLVSMVVVVLGTTSVTVAVHNSEQSAYDRRRVQNVAAAEAGLNYYYSHIQGASASGLSCSLSETLQTTPTTRFSATATYYTESGTALNCPVSSGQVPTHAYIRSVGTTVANPTPQRIMETYVHLSPLGGGALGDTAIFSNGSFNWAANVSVRGADASNGDVYTNGTASFNSSTTIYGSVYSQGALTLRGNAQIRRDGWANGAVGLSNNTAIHGNATSSTSSVSTANKSKIYGNARAGTTISGSGILGTKTPNSPQGPPPLRAFPTYTYNQADWIAEGYQIHTVTNCTSARNTINGITGGSHVVRIMGGSGADCTLTGSYTVRGDLAIVSDGGYSGGKFTASGGPWNLYLFFGMDNDGQPCNVQFGPPHGGTGANLNALIYTPCTVILRPTARITSGQVFGGAVHLNANTGVTYKPVPVPGVPGEGFKEDIEYIREVVG